MSAFSITNSAPSERRLTGKTLFLLAGLAALGALATNIILPAFPRIGASLGVSSQELGLTLSSFFVAFAFGQLLVGPLSDGFGRGIRLWPHGRRSALSPSGLFSEPCHRRALYLLRGGAGHPDGRTGSYGLSARIVLRDYGSSRLRGWVSRAAPGPSLGPGHS